MSRRCDITGVGVQVGNNVSHSNRKTKKRFLPNLQNVSLLSDSLKSTIKLRITTATLRSIDHNGGLDAYLLKTSSSKLTVLARNLKKRIQAALPEEEKAKAKKPAAKKEKKTDTKAA